MSSPNKLFHIGLKPNGSRYDGVKTYSRQSMQQAKQQTNQTTNRQPNQVSKQTTLFIYKSKEDNSIVNQGEITFTQHDYSLLRTPKYLNDTIISFFMQYHLDRYVPDDIKRKMHLFNSFFFAKIKAIREKQLVDRNSINLVSRWLKGVKIFSKDFLIMPICERDHWLLVIVCYPDKVPSSTPRSIADEDLYEPAVIVLNSWKNSTPSIKRILGHFLTYQWRFEKNSMRTFLISNAHTPAIKLLFPSLPQQRNNYNCGVYLLNYFYCFLKNPRLNYIQMYRNREMSRWFENYSVDINFERLNMKKIVDNQKIEWIKKQSNNNTNVSREADINSNNEHRRISCSTSKGSDNEVHMITDDIDKNNDNNNEKKIVVINII